MVTEYVLLEDGVGVMLAEDGVTPIILSTAAVDVWTPVVVADDPGFWAPVELGA